MSRIDELIQQYCPDGVESLSLGELEDEGVLKLGRGKVISRTDLVETPGDFPVYSSSAANNGEFGRYGNFMFQDERITWSIDGGGKFFHRVPHKYSVTNVCGWMEIKELDRILTKYMYYVLIHQWQQRTYNYTVKAHPSVIRDDYLIPVPPLEVQREIVSILDTFTQLEAELEAELEARRQQFKYFCDSLYSAPYLDSVSTNVTKTLGEVGAFTRGNGLQKSDLTSKGIGCIHYGQIFTFYKTQIFDTKSFVSNEMANRLRKASKGDLVIATTSENDADVCKTVVWLGSKEIGIGGETYIFRHNLDPLFAVYYFKSELFQFQKRQKISGTKVRRVHGDAMAKFVIVIPEMQHQTFIGQTLSTLESLLESMEYGLPAEIEARRQQYEYYRDKLLTFDELASV